MAAASDSSLDTSVELTAQQQRDLLVTALGAALWQVGLNSSVSYFKHDLVSLFLPDCVCCLLRPASWSHHQHSACSPSLLAVFCSSMIYSGLQLMLSGNYAASVKQCSSREDAHTKLKPHLCLLTPALVKIRHQTARQQQWSAAPKPVHQVSVSTKSVTQRLS